jgi:hypothetical protein
MTKEELTIALENAQHNEQLAKDKHDKFKLDTFIIVKTSLEISQRLSSKLSSKCGMLSLWTGLFAMNTAIDALEAGMKGKWWLVGVSVAVTAATALLAVVNFFEMQSTKDADEHISNALSLIQPK